MLIAAAVIWLTPKPPLRHSQIITPLDRETLYSVLEEGHLEYFGSKPSYLRLSSGWAQVAFENGLGQKIYNFNLGNIGSSRHEAFFTIAGAKFKVNNSAQEGAVIYWKTIDQRCKSVLPYFDAGAVEAAAAQLSRCGYYRDDVKHYTRNMSNLFWQARKDLAKK